MAMTLLRFLSSNGAIREKAADYFDFMHHSNSVGRERHPNIIECILPASRLWILVSRDFFHVNFLLSVVESGQVASQFY